MKTKDLEKKVSALCRMCDRGSLRGKDSAFIGEVIKAASDGRKTSKRIALLSKLTDLQIIAQSSNV